MRVYPGSKEIHKLDGNSEELLVASEATQNFDEKYSAKLRVLLYDFKYNSNDGNKNQNLKNLTAYLSRDLDSRGVVNPMDVAKEIRLLRKDWAFSPEQVDEILSQIEGQNEDDKYLTSS
ncbi:MAG: hypothetical protein HRT47_08840 [Candidatus Caenarcaniphilales bacterium]|nr:hypothetical protein [Candidatus Caenarcaniphilales bacterium]